MNQYRQTVLKGHLIDTDFRNLSVKLANSPVEYLVMD
jgi:hypothetical protein